MRVKEIVTGLNAGCSGRASKCRFEAVVAIRGVWWEGSHLQVPAGCGVIEASRMVNEWRELRLKREAVMRIIHAK